jgi:hypothetical protein
MVAVKAAEQIREHRDAPAEVVELAVQALLDRGETKLEPLEALVHAVKARVDSIESIVDLFEPPIDLFEPPIDLFEPLVDLFEPLVDLFEPLVDLLEPLVELLELLVMRRLSRDENFELSQHQLHFCVGHCRPPQECPEQGRVFFASGSGTISIIATRNRRRHTCVEPTCQAFLKTMTHTS